jgi:hypothetical protein
MYGAIGLFVQSQPRLQTDELLAENTLDPRGLENTEDNQERKEPPYGAPDRLDDE